MDIEIQKNIIEVPIGQIMPCDDSHETDVVIDMLKHSIQEFGLQQPIIIDKNKNIVAGNGLYRACVDLGIEKVPCISVDNLTEEQVKQYRIADNKTSGFASWNESKLKKELSYLPSPQSLQFCFDEDISRMMGFNEPVKLTPKNTEPERHVVSTEERDRIFKVQLGDIDNSMSVKPTEYITHTCSKCGKEYTFKK
jgi:hypothetical protein